MEGALYNASGEVAVITLNNRPYSYPEFLAALADPAHPEHNDLLEWHGGPFDPAAFDLEAIERRLASIKL